MGFLEYAWTASLQKDNLKLKITLDPLLNQPALKSDDFGFTLNLPTPRVLDEEHVSKNIKDNIQIKTLSQRSWDKGLARILFGIVFLLNKYKSMKKLAKLPKKKFREN